MFILNENLRKHIPLCKVLIHMEVKGNKTADKTAKKAIDGPEMATARLSDTH